MDLQVAIFLLIFLSLSSLATIGICFVEIRSCWRQYRLKVETKKLRKLNILDDNEELTIEHDNDCVIETDQDMDQPQILYNPSTHLDPHPHPHPSEHFNPPQEEYHQQPQHFHHQIEEVFMNIPKKYVV